MFPFSRPKKREHIVVDIGSHSIKTILYEPGEIGGVPRGLKKMVTRLSDSYDGLRIIRVLHELLFSILRDTERVPEHITIGIGPNLADSALNVWTTSPASPKETLSTSRLQYYFQNLFEENRDKSRLVFVQPVDIFANGYTVTPRALAVQDSRHIQEIGFAAVVVSFSPQVGDALTELRRMFGGISVEFVSHAVAWKEAICRSLGVHNAYIIDIGGTFTSLVYVQEQRLTHLISFPIGAQRFIHRIIKTRGATFEEAQDLKRQYSQGLVDKDDKDKLSHVLSQEAGEWKQKFMETLESSYSMGPLPEDILVGGGGSYIPEIRSTLWSPELTRTFSYIPSFNVRILQGSSVFGGNTLEGFLKGPEDVGLASLMHYSFHHSPLF